MQGLCRITLQVPLRDSVPAAATVLIISWIHVLYSLPTRHMDSHPDFFGSKPSPGWLACESPPRHGRREFSLEC